MECSICGISDKMRDVSQVITPKGIDFVCEKCSLENGYPRVKKIKPIDSGKPETMYQRMARIAGVSPKKEEERPWIKNEDKSLKDIVNKNYEKKVKSELLVRSRSDLVENFHWIIMRVRRVKGLTQSQLAERISEPEAAIRMAEQGVVPEGYALVDKLERFLKVKLIKQRDLTINSRQEKSEIENKKDVPKPFSKEEKTNQTSLKFDRFSLSSLRIADLKKIKTEEEKINEPEEEKEEAEKANVRNYHRLDYE